METGNLFSQRADRLVEEVDRTQVIKEYTLENHDHLVSGCWELSWVPWPWNPSVPSKLAWLVIDSKSKSTAGAWPGVVQNMKWAGAGLLFRWVVRAKRGGGPCDFLYYKPEWLREVRRVSAGRNWCMISWFLVHFSGPVSPSAGSGGD